MKFLPKRPPAIVEADGDRIVLDLMKVPAVADNRRLRRMLDDPDARGERAGGGDGPGSPVRGAAGEPQGAAEGAGGAAGAGVSGRRP